MPRFPEVIGAVIALGSLGVVSYAAIMGIDNNNVTALVAVLSAATGFYLRGRVDAAAGRSDGGH